VTRNLADLVRDAAEDFPAKAVLIFQGRSLTFQELDQRVDLTAAALAGLGVRQGDRVVLLAGNIPEFVSSFYGVLRAGGVACPLNVMLTPEELGHIVADSGATVAITDLTSMQGILAAKELAPELRTIVVIGGPPAPAGTVSLEEALSGEEELPDVQTEGSDLAVIAYTAGTTAEPKGAMLTHGNLLANIEQMMSVPALAEVEEDVVLLALPLFHIYALNVALGLVVRNGATAVLVERFDPKETLELIGRHEVTVILGAPPMFSAWLAAVEGGAAADFSSVRLAASGAAPLPGAVLEAFRDRFGVTIWEGYGLTESAPAVTTTALGAEARPDSIGLPLPGLEVRLVDEHTGEDADEDDPGEIWVRGPNVFAGYWNRPDATAQVLDEEGWLHTGDIAYRDEDGYLFIVDRKKDLIIVSGFNVFPKEVEEAAERHPAVEEAAAIGIPDERTGEGVQLWVVPVEDSSLDANELLAFLSERLARFKLPKDVQIVGELPHHVTGKVLRRILREP
jgi:long-chain acyl-CoA synthetase